MIFPRTSLGDDPHLRDVFLDAADLPPEKRRIETCLWRAPSWAEIEAAEGKDAAALRH
jgi:hypothetical protein